MPPNNQPGARRNYPHPSTAPPAYGILCVVDLLTKRAGKMTLIERMKMSISMEPKFRRAFVATPTLNAFELIDQLGTRCTQAHVWFVVFAIAARVAHDFVMKRGLDSPQVAAEMGLDESEAELLLLYADAAYWAGR